MEKVASKDVKDEGGVHLEGGDQGAMATAADGNGHAPDEQSVWTVVKANPKVIMYSLAMSSGPLLFGFDILTVGVVTGVPFFQITFGTPYGPQQYLIPSLWLGLWNAMLSFGGMVGSWLAGMALVRFGRKIPFVAAGLISIGGVLCLYYSDRGTTLNTRRSVFLVGKIILGFAMGVEIACTQTYISEIAPKRLRAPLLALFMVAIAIGQLAAISVVLPRFAIFAPESYRIAFLAELAFSGLTVIVGTTVPESPVYLLQTNQPEKALKAYSRLHNASDVSGGLAALSSSLEEEREITAAAAGDEAGGYLECFRHVNFRRTRIIIWCNIFQQFLGTPLLSNAPYFFQLVGMSSSLSLDLVEIGTGVNVAGTLLGAYILTKIGRRPLILFGTAFVAVLWLAIGIAGCFPQSHKALLCVGILIMVVSLILVGGLGTVLSAVAAETSSVKLRAQSQGIGFAFYGFFQWLFSFFVPYLFNADEADLGGKIGFFFFGFCIITWIIAYLDIPEFKGRSFVEMDELFSKRVPTRQFSEYQTSMQEDGDNKGGSTAVAL